VREYSFEATGETIGALRHLQRPWRAAAAGPDGLTVHCGTGALVRLEAVEAELEPGFTATCLMAALVEDAPAAALPTDEPPAGFDTGLNEVVLFNSESWLEDERPGHGPPGARPDSADAACIVSDAILLDAGGGARLLVRAAPDGPVLLLVRDAGEIAAFVEARGYDE
jgi:hypothetical protein